MADENTTYGPAQERRTKTPIVYQNWPAGQHGGYQELPPLEDFPQLFKSNNLATGLSQGVINVNKNESPSDQSNTIRHEAIHQVLTKQLAGKIGIDSVRKLTSNLPAFPAASAAVSQIGSGNMQDEAPAYSLSGDPRLAGNDWISQYKQEILDQLGKLQMPQISSQLQRLSQ